MAHYYGILAILGWAWALIVFTYLYLRLRSSKQNEKHL
jgi:hypothetical protein